MFGRLRASGRSLGRISRACGSAVLAVIGVDELVLVLALGLIAAGFWRLWPPGAFLVPGFVLLWIAMPSRRTFIERRAEESPAAKRRAR